MLLVLTLNWTPMLFVTVWYSDTAYNLTKKNVDKINNKKQFKNLQNVIPDDRVPVVVGSDHCFLNEHWIYWMKFLRRPNPRS